MAVVDAFEAPTTLFAISASWLRWFITISISSMSHTDTADPRSVARSDRTGTSPAPARVSTSPASVPGELIAAEGAALAAPAMMNVATSTATIDRMLRATSFRMSSR